MGTTTETPILDVQAVQLNRQIDAAERNLLLQRRFSQDQSDDASMGVIFTGNFHHSIPHNLLFDPVLTPADKTFWMIIRANITNPQAPGYVPSRDELSIAMNCSAPTVSRARATLRIGRWMTYLRTVRDENKRFVGDIYLLHEEPLSIADTLELDNSYIRFLEDQVSGSSTSKNNRHLAASMLADIERLISAPVSPTQREILEQRLGVASKLPSSDFRNSLAFAFGGGGLSDQLMTQSKIFTPAFESIPAEKPSNPQLDSTRSKNFTAEDATQRKNFTLGQDAENTQRKNFALDVSSGSCSSSLNINNKYISTRAHESAEQRSVDQSRLDGTADLSVAEEAAEILGNNHLEFLVTPESLSQLKVWSFYFAHIPVLGRKLLRLGDKGKREVAYQLFGRLVASHAGRTEKIQNLIGFAHTLVTRFEAGDFALDEWGIQARDVIEERMPWYIFFESPTDTNW